MYELLILSLLIRFPLHGYMIAKIVNDSIGPRSKISNGTLYPLLAKLEQGGFISSVQDEQEAKDDRHARTFQITERGRKRFHQLMMDTSSNQADYQRIFRYKVSCLYLLQPRERLHLLTHYINYCQSQVLYYKSEAEDFAHEHEPIGTIPADPSFLENTLDALQYSADQWQAEMEWTMRVRERERARIELEQPLQDRS